MSEPTIVITEGAQKRILHLIEIEGDPSLMFRVYITGGGCSGFQYGFSFERDAEEDDYVIDTPLPEGITSEVVDKLKVVIDPMSMQYLEGSQVIYQEGLYGAHFTVSNPNAKGVCGCGNSVSF